MSIADTEPLLWVRSTSGSWEDEALVAQLLPPAAVLDESALHQPPPPHPYLVIVARETQPSCEMLLRHYGMVEYDDGATGQHCPDGWIIVATVFLATAPGQRDKVFRNYAHALADDPQRQVLRVPFMPRWRLKSIVELPRWDFTPTPRRGRRGDGIPDTLAAELHELMIAVRDIERARSGTPAPDATATAEPPAITDSGAGAVAPDLAPQQPDPVVAVAYSEVEEQPQAAFRPTPTDSPTQPIPLVKEDIDDVQPATAHDEDFAGHRPARR